MGRHFRREYDFPLFPTRFKIRYGYYIISGQADIHKHKLAKVVKTMPTRAEQDETSDVLMIFKLIKNKNKNK